MDTMQIGMDTNEEASTPLSGENVEALPSRFQPSTALTAETVCVSVVVPTLDEAANIPHVFACLPDGIFEVILVDGHSSDDTVAVATAIRPDVRVVMESQRGKGAAIAAGFAAARGDIAVMLDADGSADPAEIPAFVEALLNGADFAKGSRFMEGGDSVDITWLRRMGNRTLNGVVNLLFGTDYTDLCYGYNAIWTPCIPLLNVDCDGFEVETLINVRAARAGLRVAEVPSFEHERLHGESKLRTWRDGGRVMRTIIRERLRRHNASPTHEEGPSPTHAEDFAAAGQTSLSATTAA